MAAGRVWCAATTEGTTKMIWHERPPVQNELDPERELELRLTAQARAGAAWALSALVARYQPPVVRYLVRLTGSQQTAYALAEHVFVRMGKRLRGPQGGGHLRLWLLRAATDAGLDAIRVPVTQRRGRLLTHAGPAGLLPAVVAEPRVSRVLTTLGVKPSVRPADASISATREFVWQNTAAEGATPGGTERADGAFTPEQVRQRLLRAVLAELPYDEAQCLALHLVAGLNQSDVAQALGLPDVVVRRRIVQGLEFFGGRYATTLSRLGLDDEDSGEAGDARTLEDAPPIVPADIVVDAPPVTITPGAADDAADFFAVSAGGPLALADDAPSRLQSSESAPATSLAEADALQATSTPAPAADGTGEPACDGSAMSYLDVLERASASAASVEASEGDTESRALTRLSVVTRPLTDFVDSERPRSLRHAPLTWRIVDLEDNAPPPARVVRDVVPTDAQQQPDACDVVAAASGVGANDAPQETVALDVQKEPDAGQGSYQTAPPTESPSQAAFAARAPVTRPLDTAALSLPSHGNPPPPAIREAVARSGAEALAPVPAARPQARRMRRVLSADGEAEDPGDEIFWPLR